MTSTYTLPPSLRRLMRLRDRLGLEGTIQFVSEVDGAGRSRMQYSLYTSSTITILGYSLEAARGKLRALAKEASNGKR